MAQPRPNTVPDGMKPGGVQAITRYENLAGNAYVWQGKNDKLCCILCYNSRDQGIRAMAQLISVINDENKYIRAPNNNKILFDETPLKLGTASKVLQPLYDTNAQFLRICIEGNQNTGLIVKRVETIQGNSTNVNPAASAGRGGSGGGTAVDEITAGLGNLNLKAQNAQVLDFGGNTLDMNSWVDIAAHDRDYAPGLDLKDKYIDTNIAQDKYPNMTWMQVAREYKLGGSGLEQNAFRRTKNSNVHGDVKHLSENHLLLSGLRLHHMVRTLPLTEGMTVAQRIRFQTDNRTTLSDLRDVIRRLCPRASMNLPVPPPMNEWQLPISRLRL